MSSPSSVIRPVTRQLAMVSFIRFRQRRKVDLPQPDGPMKAVTVLSRISTSTSLQRMVVAIIHLHVARGDLGLIGYPRLSPPVACHSWFAPVLPAAFEFRGAGKWRLRSSRPENTSSTMIAPDVRSTKPRSATVGPDVDLRGQRGCGVKRRAGGGSARRRPSRSAAAARFRPGPAPAR